MSRPSFMSSWLGVFSQSRPHSSLSCHPHKRSLFPFRLPPPIPDRTIHSTLPSLNLFGRAAKIDFTQDSMAPFPARRTGSPNPSPSKSKRKSRSYRRLDDEGGDVAELALSVTIAATSAVSARGEEFPKRDDGAQAENREPGMEQSQQKRVKRLLGFGDEEETASGGIEMESTAIEASASAPSRTATRAAPATIEPLSAIAAAVAAETTTSAEDTPPSPTTTPESTRAERTSTTSLSAASSASETPASSTTERIRDDPRTETTLTSSETSRATGTDTLSETRIDAPTGRPTSDTYISSSLTGTDTATGALASAGKAYDDLKEAKSLDDIQAGYNGNPVGYTIRT
jgi:hypothetical protein